MDPLFEYIASAAVNGELPQDFSLPARADDENAIRWADGALDGVGLYHMNIPEMSEDDRVLMSDAVRAADMKDFDLADQLFRMLGRHIQAIFVIDDLHSYIIENRSVFKASVLFEYAIRLFFTTEDKESLKLALSLLELFKTDDRNDLKSAVRTAGLSDEFALFAIFVMMHWKDRNKEIWQLAKKVHGWGRIHAVERIEPETEEIRHWLLTEGVHNDVMPAYSALTCWNKSRAEDILRRGPSGEEFTGIKDIISGLLDEGPVPGFSQIQNKDEIMSLFIDAAETMELTPEEHEEVNEIFCTYSNNYVTEE